MNTPHLARLFYLLACDQMRPGDDADPGLRWGDLTDELKASWLSLVELIQGVPSREAVILSEQDKRQLFDNGFACGKDSLRMEAAQEIGASYEKGLEAGRAEFERLGRCTDNTCLQSGLTYPDDDEVKRSIKTGDEIYKRVKP